MTEIFAGVFILAGALFLCLAGLTLLRFPDLLTRLSASTKAVTFGAGLTFVAVAIFFHDVDTDARAVAGILFFAITAPVSGTVIARSAMRVGVPVWSATVYDEAAKELTGEDGQASAQKSDEPAANAADKPS